MVFGRRTKVPGPLRVAPPVLHLRRQVFQRLAHALGQFGFFRRIQVRPFLERRVGLMRKDVVRPAEKRLALVPAFGQELQRLVGCIGRCAIFFAHLGDMRHQVGVVAASEIAFVRVQLPALGHPFDVVLVGGILPGIDRGRRTIPAQSQLADMGQMPLAETTRPVPIALKDLLKRK